MGMTIAEKILAAHAIPHREEVKPGEYIWARIDETNAFGDALAHMKKLGIKSVLRARIVGQLETLKMYQYWQNYYMCMHNFIQTSC
jgi:hypothetical protein